MKYLVLEIHPAYAVLLDQCGKFVKASKPELSGGRDGAECDGTERLIREEVYPPLPAACRGGHGGGSLRGSVLWGSISLIIRFMVPCGCRSIRISK